MTTLQRTATASEIAPPRQKKRNDAIRYMYPIVLWSVDVSQLTTTLPLRPTLEAPKS